MNELVQQLNKSCNNIRIKPVINGNKLPHCNYITTRQDKYRTNGEKKLMADKRVGCPIHTHTLFIIADQHRQVE